jgi:hypothetical protein
MRRRIAASLICLAFAGCLTPFTSRLDQANRNATAMQEQLVIANAKLVEATAVLERSEKKLNEATVTLEDMDRRLADMEKRFATMEQLFRRAFGIKDKMEEE